MDLTDEQWELLEQLIPDPPRRPDGRGRPWRDLPERYPPYQTCHRRFQRWSEEGVLDEILRALAEDLKDRGGLDVSECFVDGTFGGASVGKAKRDKGTKLMALADASGLPLSVCAASASPHEVTLVGEILARSFLNERPERLIGDRVYDSDPLDAELAKRDIELIALQEQEEAQNPGRAQDQALEDRASVRLVVRYERRVENYLGFVKLGGIVILLRHLLNDF